MIMENKVTEREVDTLTKICQTLILKYTHHIVWRRLDPPNANWPEEFKPHRFPLPNDFLPNDTQDEEKNPDRFRKNLKLVREYFSSNLVRPVYNSLSEECVKLVTNNVLKHGDIILQLVFQDELSRLNFFVIGLILYLPIFPPCKIIHSVHQSCNEESSKIFGEGH